MHRLALGITILFSAVALSGWLIMVQPALAGCSSSGC
jgi:hypothetical protein